MAKTPVSWRAYHEKTAELPPRESLVRAVELVTERDAALDVGAGGLRDTRYLLDKKFKHVVVLDQDPAVAARLAELSNPRATAEIRSLESYVAPKNTFNLINAQYTLPFVSPEYFTPVFLNLVDALKVNGVIVGQCFGPKDEWREDPDMTFCTLGELENALAQLDILDITENEHDERTALGDPKHWHVLQFFARK